MESLLIFVNIILAVILIISILFSILCAFITSSKISITLCLGFNDAKGAWNRGPAY